MTGALIRSTRRVAGALALAGLAACSSSGDSTPERLAPLIQQSVLGDLLGTEEAPPAPPVFTRAQLNEVPFATIAVKDDDGNRAYVVPVSDNGGYLVYQDAARSGVIMRGGLVTATQGQSYDLQAVRHAADDPIVTPTPVAEWPQRVFRNYQFNLYGGAKDFQITTSCRYEAVARERIEIVELFFDTVRMVETCSNTERSFQNTYWADPNSGFIWKSRQWLGPRRGFMEIEIIRPYAAG